MTTEELYSRIKEKKSFLCVGLDTDINQLPAHLKNEDDPVFAFNKAIIDATLPYAVAYKPNMAFYECLGSKGWESLEKTLRYLPNSVFKIADAKRGDIGNTSDRYAQTFFEHLNFDSVTLSPYMGKDSIEPYLKYPGKYAIVLALTSNPGALDFQLIPTSIENKALFEKVLIRSSRWGSKENMMYVVGATRPEMLKKIREIIPEHFLLVPGVGAQGGNLQEVAENGFTHQCGLLVNASRSILYASKETDFAEKAACEAAKLQAHMQALLLAHSLL